MKNTLTSTVIVVVDFRSLVLQGEVNFTSQCVFCISGQAGEQLYPAFFAEPCYDRLVLEKICKVLGDMPGGSKWDFFMSKKISLGDKTPLGALLEGKIDLVLLVAAGFAQQ